MEMEGLENNNDATHNIAKGKRTKRLRLCGVSGAATTVMMTSSCSSANSGGASFSSTTTSTDQEEEDMANCLILLAQGGKVSHPHPHPHHHHHHHHHDVDHVDDGNKTEKGNRRFAELATATTATNNNTKVGFYIYECKTCNRTFPSFQALGGHRASHKRLKLMPEEKKPPPPPPPPPQLPHLIVGNYDQFEEAHIKSVPHPISLQLGHKAFHNNNKGKIHECSICGSEFTSGQALGGHMRRHRTSSSANLNTTIDASCNTITTATTIVADTTNNAVSFQPRNILQLDLNLPAPEDDIRVQFTASQKSMVLAGAPALVDCHY